MHPRASINRPARLNPWKVASACAMSFLLVMGQSAPLLANPSGGQVVAGSATIGGSGSTVTINQSTAAAIINWQQFSINSGELTKFLVPNSSSATLNRVLSYNNPSLIYGTLQSNGIVYLVNPSGIVVGPNGRIDTAGFIGSTLDVSDDQFLKGGNLNFVGNSGAGIDNEGVIHASSGDVYLIAAQVTNGGTISAPQGNVGLAAASNVLYQPAGNQHLFIQSNPTGTTRAVGVTNSGTVQAATAELRATGGNAYALAINNTGSIAASGYKKVNGQVFLTSDGGNITNSGKISAQNSDGSGGAIVVDGTATSAPASGTVINSGTLDASAKAAGADGGSITLKSKGGTAIHTGQILAQGGQGGTGGNVDISGEWLQFTGSVNLSSPGGKTGNLLIDPATLTVQSAAGNLSSGDFFFANSDSGNGSYNNPADAGANDTVAASVIDGLLTNANVTLNADTNITVNSGITWTTPNILNLTTNVAGSTIHLNAPIVGASGGLTIDTFGSTDAITTGINGSVDVATFILQSGSWQQIASGQNQPSFTASHDFELQGDSTFLRVASGNGTSGSPYQITDIYGLQGLASPSGSMLGAYAELMNDIDATGTATWNHGAGFVPIGSDPVNGSGPAFTGELLGQNTLNGPSYTINGLYINAPNSSYVGLFGELGSAAIIADVGLINEQVNGNINVGGLAGQNNGTILKSYATGYVNGAGEGNSIGGLVGYNDAGSITLSYSSASVSANNSFWVGGLVGDNGGNIQNTYSTGAVSGGDNVGGLVGAEILGSIYNSYSSGAVTSLDSGSLGGLLGELDTGSVTDSFWDTVTSGVNNGVGTYSGANSVTDVYGLTTSDLLNINTYTGANTASEGAVITVTASGSSSSPNLTPIPLSSSWSINSAPGTGSLGGTWVIFNGQTRPLLSSEYNLDINNAHQLQLIDANTTTLGATYTLVQNIDASGTGNPSDIWGTTTSTVNNTAGFVPIGTSSLYFTGSFDGQNYAINDLNIYQQYGQYVGLFAITSTASTVKNVGLTNAQITGDTDVGGLVGLNEGAVVFDNNYVTGAVTGSDLVGGLIGESLGSISDSYNASTVTGVASVGGLVGSFNYQGISDSYNTGAVNGSSQVGGIAGYNNGTLTYTFNTGAVDGISSAQYLGGLVGFNDTTGLIENTFSTGAVGISDTPDYSGGLVGANYGTVEKSFATGAVGGTTQVGGLVGSNFSLVETSFATGAVSAYDSVGGLVGYNNGGSVETSYSTGPVSGSSSVGGLVGNNYGGGGTIETSYWAQDTGLNPGLYGIGSNGGSPSNTGAVPETLNAMKTAATFTATASGAPLWNFTTGTGIWTTFGETISPQLQNLSTTISGTTYSDAGSTLSTGAPVQLIFNGAEINSIPTDGSGNFTLGVSFNELTDGLLLTDSRDNADSYYQTYNLSGSVGSISLWGNYLLDLADNASNTALGKTAGTLTTGAGVNYVVNSSNLMLNGGVSMSVQHNYTIDGDITAPGVFTSDSSTVFSGAPAATVQAYAVDISGTFNRTGALTITSTAGDVILDNVGSYASPATLPGLTLNATGSAIVNDSYLALNGGDFTATGTGNSNSGNLDGVDVFSSTIDTQGGSISLTGQANYQYQAGEGNYAGSGVVVAEVSTLETASPFESSITTGDITIVGNGSLQISGSPVSVINNLNGVIFDDSTASVADGNVSITGTVSSGDVSGSLDYTNGDVYGIALQNNTTIQATGSNGSVAIVGSVKGATNEIGNAIGVLISGKDYNTGEAGLTTVSSAGDGLAYTDINANEYYGIYILGTGGGVTNTASGNNNSADGVNATQGATITTQVDSGSGDIHIYGLGGSNYNPDDSTTGSAVGVDLSTDKDGDITIATFGGLIYISGNGAAYGTSSTQGMGVLIAGVNGYTVTIDTTGGDIDIYGQGASGYAGSPFIEGEVTPNYGVAIADGVTIQTGDSGDININGYGGSDSFDVGITQLPPDSFDSSSTIPTPVITAGGDFNVDTDTSYIGGHGSFINATVTAVNATLGAGTDGDVTSITSGPLDIENSTFTLGGEGGGNFDAFGMGTANLVPGLTSLSGISIDRNPYGLTIDSTSSLTTINANGGNITLTGEANHNTDPSAGLVAGEGVSLLYTTLETNGSGGISITGDASVGVSTTVQNSLIGVEINTSNLTTVDGQIYLYGTVNSGTADSTTTAAGDGYTVANGHTGIYGVVILDGGVGATTPTSTLIAADQSGDGSGDGSIVIIGDTTGSISDASVDTTTSEHDNIAVMISDNNTQIISGDDGYAHNRGDNEYDGLYIQGSGGEVDNNLVAEDGSSASVAGVKIKGGSTIEGLNSSDVTVFGSADWNSVTGNSLDGTAVGVIVISDGGSATNANHGTTVETASGNILLDGFGGESPNGGIGVAVLGTYGASTLVTSAGGNITFNGTGGTQEGTGYGGVHTYLANFGVLVGDAATVDTSSGSGSITLTGSGVGGNTAGVAIEELNSALDTTVAKPSLTAGDGTVTLNTLGNSDVVVDSASVTAGVAYIQVDSSSDVADSSVGAVYLMGATFTLADSDGYSNSFLAFGSGTTEAPIVDNHGNYGGPSTYSKPQGILVANSTIDARTGAGAIDLTGQAASYYNGVANYVGAGIAIESSTLETAGTGQIDITGHGGVNVVTLDDLIGVLIGNYGLIQGLGSSYPDSNLTTVDGLINITGDVTAGTALNTTANSGNGATGILIDQGSVVQATGAITPPDSVAGVNTGGAVYLSGDTSGATTDGTTHITNNHDNRGVVIIGTGTKVTSAGDGLAYTDISANNYYGIYINGTGGTINNNQEAYDSTGAASANGVTIANGATVQGTGYSDITLVGQGGPNNTLGGEVLGNSIGVDLISNNLSGSTGSVSVSTATGNILADGTGGTSPNAGIGVFVGGFYSPYTVQVASTSGTITFNGTGATGNSGPGSTYADVVYGHNGGISIVGASTLSTAGSGGINLHGTGTLSGTVDLGVTVDQLGLYAGPKIDATGGELTVDTTVGSTDLGDIYFSNTSLPTLANANIDTDGVYMLANGLIHFDNTYVVTNGNDFSATGNGVAGELDGIDVFNSTINAQGGSIYLTGTAGTTGATVGNAGVYLGSSTLGPATLTTIGNGGITVLGDGSTSATATITHDLLGVALVNGSQVSVANGAIDIEGTVADGTTSGNVIGVSVQNGANTIKATGTGSVTIIGNDTATYPATTVSTAETSSYGVLLDGATVSAFDASGSGPSGINITGTAGSLANEGTDSAADGVEINGGSTITSAATSATAPITITGYGGIDVNTNSSLGTRAYGVYLVGGTGPTSVTSALGSILINGTAGTSTIGSAGFEANGLSSTVLVNITSGSGAITLDGEINSPSSLTQSINYQGIGLYETHVTSGSGPITFTGTIGNNIEGSQITATSFNASSVNTTTGAINIYGYVNSSGAVAGGPVADIDTYPSIDAVVLYNSSIQASSSGSNYGTINIYGNATNSTASYGSYGVDMYGGSTVTSAGGVPTLGIQISGYAGTVYRPVLPETGGLSVGIYMENGSVKDTNAGAVELLGYGGIDTESAATLSASDGVFVTNYQGTSALNISTGSGLLTINGQGKNSNYEVGGVTIETQGGAATNVSSTSGRILIHGFTDGTLTPSVSDELFGVVLKGAQVTTAGEIDLVGTVATGTAAVRAFGVRVSEDAKVSASGNGAYVDVIGDTSGTTTSSVGTTSDGINVGVIVEGAGSTISSAGASGVDVTGYAGATAGSATSAVVDSGSTGDNVAYTPQSDGILISDWGNVTALSAAPMSLTGTGGDNNNSATTSSSAGVAILSPVSGQTTGILAGTGTVTIDGEPGSSGNSALYAILMGGANNVGSVVAGSSGLINFLSIGGGDINLNGVDATDIVLNTAGNVTQDGVLSSLQNTPITTSLLSITNAAVVTLTNAGNAIAALGNIVHNGALTVVTDPGLAISGQISGNAPVTLTETGGDVTFDPSGQIIDSGSGNNVIIAAGTDLASSHYIINDSTSGANAIQVSSGAGYALFSSDPTYDTFSGLTFTQPDTFNATYATTGLQYNGAYYYAAQGAVGPNGPQPSNPGTGTGSGSSDNNTNNTQSQLTPPNNTIAPQTPPPSNNNPTGPNFDNGSGNGNSNQTNNNTGLANSSGSSGDVGSGDTAQLNDGELNNVSNPAASSALNQALSAVVLGNLTDALKDLGDYDASAGNGGGPAGTDVNGTPDEQNLGAGDVIEMGGGTVQNVPPDQIPQQLKDALGSDALNGVPTQTSH
jgi:filamentous hemagglutinin family protein